MSGSHEFSVYLRVTGAASLGSDVGCLWGLNDLLDGFLLRTRPQQDEDRHIGNYTLHDKPPCCVPLVCTSLLIFIEYFMNEFSDPKSSLPQDRFPLRG